MKKNIVAALAIMVGTFSFAQKKEIKALEKAVKGNNFAQAKTLLGQLESMVPSMDTKLKTKYYYNAAKALYANGAGSDADIDKALKSLGMLDGAMAKESGMLKQTMQNGILTKANEQYQAGNYKSAAGGFDKLYKINPQDTVYLYYAASSAVSGKDYDTAISHYKALKDLGYTGVETQYFALNKETGKEEIMDKNTRDLYVKAGSHSNPGERKTDSKKAEIVKNIALIYISQGKKDEALAAIKDAREANPENVDLIISEANIQLELGNNDKFKSLMEEAVAKDPNNASLHYNIGVMQMKGGDLTGCRSAFTKALELDPTMADAVLNISTSYIDEGNSLIEEMNKLGTSAADNAKYDALKAKKEGLFREGIKVLSAFVEKNPDTKNVGVYQQMQNIHNALYETDKAKALDAKIQELSGN